MLWASQRWLRPDPWRSSGARPGPWGRSRGNQRALFDCAHDSPRSQMVESFRRSFAGTASRPSARAPAHGYGSPLRRGGGGRGEPRHLRAIPEGSNRFTATVLQPGWYGSVRSGRGWIPSRTKCLQIRTFTDNVERAGQTSLDLWLRRSRVRAPSVTLLNSA